MVQLGDLPDGVDETGGTIADEDEVVRRIGLGRSLIHDRLAMPVFNVMGNHEHRDPAWDKARILRAVDDRWRRTSDTWYRVSHGGFEFVFLNSAYTATVSGDHSAPDKEIEWLERTLDRISDPTFVFMHVPAREGAGGALRPLP